jgi:tetratricopeptide (TPR) repeat protein
MALHDERDTRGRSTVQVSWHASGDLPVPVALRRGIDHCRRGEWDEGLQYLLEADVSDNDQTLPGLYFSYLGHALARRDQPAPEALSLCQRGVAAQPQEPDNLLNLAWACLLARDRVGAIEALDRGLAVSPRHAGFEQIRRKLGLRRPPVLRFLRRTHPVNHLLGRLRHHWLQWRGWQSGILLTPEGDRIWQAQ